MLAVNYFANHGYVYICTCLSQATYHFYKTYHIMFTLQVYDMSVMPSVGKLVQDKMASMPVLKN